MCHSDCLHLVASPFQRSTWCWWSCSAPANTCHGISHEMQPLRCVLALQHCRDTLFTRAHVNSGFTHKAKFEGSVHGVVVHASTYEFSWALREDSRSMCSSAAGSVFTYKKQRNIVYYCVLHASTRSYISAFVFSCHFLFLRHWCVAFCSTHYCPRP